MDVQLLLLGWHASLRRATDVVLEYRAGGAFGFGPSSTDHFFVHAACGWGAEPRL